jgi:UDP:flavonoid glycosyltransferase YjiC (YdhE family)
LSGVIPLEDDVLAEEVRQVTLDESETQKLTDLMEGMNTLEGQRDTVIMLRKHANNVIKSIEKREQTLIEILGLHPHPM